MCAFINWSICRVSLRQCDDRQTHVFLVAMPLPRTPPATDDTACIPHCWVVEEGRRRGAPNKNNWNNWRTVHSPHGCMAHGTALFRLPCSCFHLFSPYCVVCLFSSTHRIQFVCVCLHKSVNFRLFDSLEQSVGDRFRAKIKTVPQVEKERR